MGNTPARCFFSNPGSVEECLAVHKSSNGPFKPALSPPISSLTAKTTEGLLLISHSRQLFYFFLSRRLASPSFSDLRPAPSSLPLSPLFLPLTAKTTERPSLSHCLTLPSFSVAKPPLVPHHRRSMPPVIAKTSPIIPTAVRSSPGHDTMKPPRHSRSSVANPSIDDHHRRHPVATLTLLTPCYLPRPRRSPTPPILPRSQA